MSSPRHADSRVPGLGPPVVARIVAELGAAGERALSCLQTAHALLDFGATDQESLRFAESAAYNVREALDSVVRDRSAGEGGLATALAAWERYKLTCGLPGAEEPTARAILAAAFDELSRQGQRQAYMTRKLLDWFQQQTGSLPISGAGDPTAEYQRLRQTASNILHAQASDAEVRALLDDVEAWFARFFAPPSDIVNRIEQLASRSYTAEGLVELRAIAMNAHHLRLFLQRIEDADWLEPMREAGLIGLPTPGEAWPVVALTGEPRRLADDAVTGLLWRLVDALKTIPVPERPSCAFDIARTAWWLGPTGHTVIVELLRRFPAVDAIQAIAMSVAGDLDAADPAQVVIADAVIGNEPDRDRGYRTRKLVGRPLDGMTDQNVDERFGLIAVKLRRLAAQERYLTLDIVSLSAEGVDEFEHVLAVAQRLAAAIPQSRALGMSSSSMLERLATISGELGDRLTCLVLAGAVDVDRQTKLSHLANRLASLTATGDDRALLQALMPLEESEIATLRDSFGTPPPASSDAARLDRDWARAWRWSMLLPPPVLEGWEQAIAAITAAHGTPDSSSMMDRRTSTMHFGTVGSPISTEDLAPLDPLQAARQIAAWRPSANDPWGVSARELARSLESLVKDATGAWTDDPVATVSTLREPVYVDHYFRAITANAVNVRERASALIRAIELVRSEQWAPTTLGGDDFDYEDDWTYVDSASAELIDALADANADLEGDLDFCWELATALSEALPDDLGSVDDHNDPSRHDDPLHRAINSTYGRAFQAVLALGGWEHRNRGAASPRLSSALTLALTIDGSVGLQFRAVIAASRPFVETIAAEWTERNQDTLFGDALGQITFDQTLKYSRPTRAFFDREVDRLLDAARRGADHAAAWLLVAHLWEVPGYSYEHIVDGLAGRESALARLSTELARLATGVPADQSDITTRALRFWKQLLAEAGDRIPTSTLTGSGGWALDSNVDPATWLELTEQTVAQTDGTISYASEVAERCRDLQPSSSGLRILAALLGRGDRWEQHHIDGIGVEALRAAASSGLTDGAFNHLRERLIQRGRHDAGAVIAAAGDRPSSSDEDAAMI